MGSQSRFPFVSTCGHWEQKPASQGGTLSGAARRGLQGTHFQVDGKSRGEDGVSVGVWISVGREVQGAKPGVGHPTGRQWGKKEPGKEAGRLREKGVLWETRLHLAQSGWQVGAHVDELKLPSCTCPCG